MRVGGPGHGGCLWGEVGCLVAKMGVGYAPQQAHRVLGVHLKKSRLQVMFPGCPVLVQHGRVVRANVRGTLGLSGSEGACAQLEGYKVDASRQTVKA